jgi:hypothetical protein
VNHTPRNCFASIRTYNTRLSTRTANRTHARKRAVSGLVIQISLKLGLYALQSEENIRIYSERQKYGINSLKIKQNLKKKNL